MSLTKLQLIENLVGERDRSQLVKLADNNSKESLTLDSMAKAEVIANSDPYLLDNQNLLLSYYREIKESWGSRVINRIKSKHKLNLRQKLDRCLLAVMAARHKIETDSSLYLGQTCSIENNVIEAKVLPPSPTELELAAKVKELEKQLEASNAIAVEAKTLSDRLERQLEQTNNQLNKQVKLNIIVATDRLLPAGPPLNGVQESPTFKILGSPTTKTQLEHNYRVLEDKLLNKVNQYRKEIKELRLHPDLSDKDDEDWSETIANYRNLKDEAIEKLNLVKSLYSLHHDNWDLLKPTIPISDEELQMRMNSEIPHGWTIKSFWE